MNDPIIIAIDAMGGDDSPNKVIEGIKLHSNLSKDVYYKIFGNSYLIEPLISKYKLPNKLFDLIHTEKIVEGEDTALSAAKRGKETSLWLAIKSLKMMKQMQLFQRETPVLYF